MYFELQAVESHVVEHQVLEEGERFAAESLALVFPGEDDAQGRGPVDPVDGEEPYLAQIDIGVAVRHHQFQGGGMGGKGGELGPDEDFRIVEGVGKERQSFEKARHLGVVDPFPQGESAIVVDSESQEEVHLSYSSEAARRYSDLLEEHIFKLKDFFHSSGISYLPARSDTELSEFLFTQLRKTGLIQ